MPTKSDAVESAVRLIEEKLSGELPGASQARIRGGTIAVMMPGTALTRTMTVLAFAGLTASASVTTTTTTATVVDLLTGRDLRGVLVSTDTVHTR